MELLSLSLSLSLFLSLSFHLFLFHSCYIRYVNCSIRSTYFQINRPRTREVERGSKRANGGKKFTRDTQDQSLPRGQEEKILYERGSSRPGKYLSSSQQPIVTRTRSDYGSLADDEKTQIYTAQERSYRSITHALLKQPCLN